jgi:hypothetical protein
MYLLSYSLKSNLYKIFNKNNISIRTLCKYNKELPSNILNNDNIYNDNDIYNKYIMLAYKNKLNNHLLKMKTLKKIINMNKKINKVHKDVHKYISYTENLYLVMISSIVTTTACIYIIIS